MSTKRSRPKRILGMTTPQLAILGVLAVLALGTIVGGFFFIANSTGGGRPALTPAPTSTLYPTVTPYLTQTPIPTPTITLVPYESLIPSGWEQYTSDTIELWVPPEFKPVDINKERQARIQFYEDLGYDDVVEELENNPPAYLFWFKYSEPGTTQVIPNITVESELMTAATLDDYLDQEYESGIHPFVVTTRQNFQVGRFEARRVQMEANVNNIYFGVVQYVIFDGQNVWFITGSSHFNEFYTWLPEFDKMARTFRLIDQ